MGPREVLGGHDHTEYLDQHNGCVLLKTGALAAEDSASSVCLLSPVRGMDAQRVGVVDLLWQGDKAAHYSRESRRCRNGERQETAGRMTAGAGGGGICKSRSP